LSTQHTLHGVRCRSEVDRSDFPAPEWLAHDLDRDL
jgi:hypothetical protein